MMTTLGLEDRLKDISRKHIVRVTYTKKPLKYSYGFSWKDELMFLGIRVRKGGMYNAWNEFQGVEKYKNPEINLHLSNGDIRKLSYNTLKELMVDYEQILYIINK